MLLRTQGTFRHCYPVYEAPIYHLRQKLYGGYVAGGLALASLVYVVYGATEGKQHFQIREVTISSDELPSGLTATALYKYLISIPVAGAATVLPYRKL